MKRLVISISIVFLVSWFESVIARPEMIDASSVVIVANEGVRETMLTRKELELIYRSEQTKWSNGEQVIVTMLKSGELHERFTEEVIGITPSKLIDIWKRIIFTGTGYPPRIFKTETDLMEFVSRTPGAIGYVSPYTRPMGVKSLDVIP